METKLHPVLFVQYLRPHGKRKNVVIDRPVEVFEMAKRLWEQGCRLEAEVLTTQEVSFEVVQPDPTEETDFMVLSSAITKNGPDVLKAVDLVITTAHGRLYPPTPTENGERNG